ncbi:MAG TPA: CPBP family intramembrane glutamic endopeptidase [Homoserinimonas sp.]|nr:CPBP family intramembrane glutamic endopeptidase [Homoserinimonas sp.]
MDATTDAQRATWPVALPYLRIGFVAIAALATSGILAAAGQPSGMPSVALYAALYLIPGNLACLLIVRRLVHRGGGTLRDLIGFDRSRLGRDFGWGLLWLAVLYVPFAATIIGSMFLLFGGDAFASFERVFAPSPADVPTVGTAVALVLAVIAVITFAPLNAPTEELVFRGYSQGRLSTLWGGTALAIVVPSIAFGLQHAFFASTVEGMVVYVAAFFVWGLGAGIIYLKQGRLMPLIVCHLIVNLFTSLPALIVPFVA